ncbi:Uu.00g036440.m01.CDS01 [Anthostomella pinea]|uniref:Uu.00g036440.m01.CDS01 n=1 Tax=Anthostomella pinea TaxID=933095 RepID=A0AAI8YDG5_9PEZI|nr:Uu.00g036440.m01.CDS01 [Anthostomella pinea]
MLELFNPPQLYMAVRGALGRIHHRPAAQAPAEQVNLASMSAIWGIGATSDESPIAPLSDQNIHSPSVLQSQTSRNRKRRASMASSGAWERHSMDTPGNWQTLAFGLSASDSALLQPFDSCAPATPLSTFANFGFVHLAPQPPLAMPSIVADTAQSVEFAMKGNIDGLKNLFLQGLASLRDWALYGGMHQSETVRFLLNEGGRVDENSYQHVWDFALRKRCSSAELQELRCIVNSEEDRNWIQEQNFPLIHEIILGLSPKLLADEIRENPGAVYKKDVQGRTALDWATARAQLDDMEILIAHGSNPNVMDITGRTTILHAVDSHNEDSLRIILQAGADPNPKMTQGLFRSSPLTSASFGGLAGIIRLLVEFGAEVDICNPEGRTPLYTVASMHDVDCAAILLDCGANPDHMSTNGHTPLDAAIIHNNHAMIELFINRYQGDLREPPLSRIINGDDETRSILNSTNRWK